VALAPKCCTRTVRCRHGAGSQMLHADRGMRWAREGAPAHIRSITKCSIFLLASSASTGSAASANAAHAAVTSFIIQTGASRPRGAQSVGYAVAEQNQRAREPHAERNAGAATRRRRQQMILDRDLLLDQEAPRKIASRARGPRAAGAGKGFLPIHDTAGNPMLLNWYHQF
jgi:hypothetical protein